MPALEAGKLQRDQIRMARDVFGGPDLAARIFRIRVLPDVLDVHRVRDFAALDFFAEQAPEYVVIERQRVLSKNRIAELLEFFHNLVVDARIVVIRAAQQHNADLVLPLEHLEHLPALAPLHDIVVVVERPVSLLNSPVILFGGQPENVFELSIKLPFQNLGFADVHKGVQKNDALLFEDVSLFGESRFYRRRRGGHGGTSAAPLRVHQVGGQAVDHGKEDVVELPFRVDHVQEIVNVRDGDLGWKARIDGAALAPSL